MTDTNHGPHTAKGKYDTKAKAQMLCEKAIHALENDDMEAYVTLLKKAAAIGDASAMNGLAMLYLGACDPADPASAEAWAKKALAAGSTEALFTVGVAYEAQGRTEEALDSFRKAAEHDDDRAMLALAAFYRNGESVKQDLGESFQYMLRAAKLGNVLAMNSVGTLYNEGIGVAQNLEKSAAWYRRAAELGDPTGMSNLSFCYESGDGVPLDKAEARKWRHRAASLGDGSAMCRTGEIELEKAHFKKAVFWFKKAAVAGDADAMSYLANAYLTGEGIKKDVKAAFSWYQKSAEGSSIDGMYGLAMCYDEGYGTPPNAELADLWYNRAESLNPYPDEYDD